MSEVFGNQAQTTVSSGGTTAPSAGTVETWTVSSGAGFPTADPTAYPPTFFRVTDIALPTEKAMVTDSRTTSWTVTRGAEGTAPVAHAAGFAIQNVVTAGALAGIVQWADIPFAVQLQRTICT